MADRLEQPPMVEPLYPGEGRQFDGLLVPLELAVDEFGLVGRPLIFSATALPWESPVLPRGRCPHPLSAGYGGWTHTELWGRCGGSVSRRSPAYWRTGPVSGHPAPSRYGRCWLSLAGDPNGEGLAGLTSVGLVFYSLNLATKNQTPNTPDQLILLQK